MQGLFKIEPPKSTDIAEWNAWLEAEKKSKRGERTKETKKKKPEYAEQYLGTRTAKINGKYKQVAIQSMGEVLVSGGQVESLENKQREKYQSKKTKNLLRKNRRAKYRDEKRERLLGK